MTPIFQPMPDDDPLSVWLHNQRDLEPPAEREIPREPPTVNCFGLALLAVAFLVSCFVAFFLLVRSVPL